MASKRRVLLVLYEGLAATVIDSTVLDHARQQGERGYDFEILAMCCLPDIYRSSLANRERAEKLAGCPVHVGRGVRPAVPFSIFFNRWLLRLKVRRLKTSYDIVHARTDYAAAVAQAIARSASLVWDCRGDAVAEAFARRPDLPRFLRRFQGWRARQVRALAGKACRRAIAVSQPLADLCAKALSGKPVSVIPCAASEDLFYVDDRLRLETRERLGFGSKERVYVYSGSLVAYQCFDETVALFTQLHAGDPHARLLVLTPQVNAARAAVNHLDPSATRVESIKLEDMNAALNAADVAFMLRAKSPINHVASPTKFAEYCLTGLPIVMTQAVESSWSLATLLGNAVRVEGSFLFLPREGDRKSIAAQAQVFLGKRHLAERYDAVYAP